MSRAREANSLRLLGSSRPFANPDALHGLTVTQAAYGANLATGITDALATAAHTILAFNFGGASYFFDHGDSSNAITVNDAMVEVAGVFNASTLDASHVIHFA
jgi:hypothetical protein